MSIVQGIGAKVYVAENYPYVPDMVFATLEEAEAEFTKWTNIIVPHLTKDPNRRVRIVFSSKEVVRRVACYNRPNDRITYYRNWMLANLQKPDFMRRIVVHECVHVIHFDHQFMFKIVCRNYGVPEPMKTKDYKYPLVNPKYGAWGEVRCPKCGVAQILNKQPLGYPNLKYKCTCGHHDIPVTRYPGSPVKSLIG